LGVTHEVKNASSISHRHFSTSCVGLGVYPELVEGLLSFYALLFFYENIKRITVAIPNAVIRSVSALTSGKFGCAVPVLILQTALVPLLPNLFVTVFCQLTISQLQI
jgi:hypothetical protein